MQFLERQVQLAVVSFYNALGFVMSYFGWQRERHNELTAPILAVLPTALRG